MELLAGVAEGDDDGAVSRRLLNFQTVNREKLCYVVCCDRSGDVVAASEPGLLEAGLAGNRGFQEALQGRPNVQYVAYDRLAGEYTLIMFAPVQDRNDPSRVVGVLCTAVDWSKVSEMILDLKVRGKRQTLSDHVMLANRDGLVISCFDPQKMFRQNLVAAGSRSAREAQQGREGYLIDVSEHGLPAFISHTPWEPYKDLPNLGWFVILLQDEESVFASVTMLDRLTLVVLSGTLACVVAGSFLLAFLISKPLLVLDSTADDIRLGERGKRVALNRRDEIGLVADAFNAMLDSWERIAEELEQSKQMAEAANRAKSEFLANMSHEIRTPMTAILGYADLLMSREWPPSERRKHLQTIHRQGNNLLRIINDILDLSKIEAEQVELEPMDCSPSEVVEEVRSLLQIRASEKNLGLETVYSYPLPKTIRTDPVRLQQILVNLVGNAIKFTRRGGVKIRVRLVQPEDPPAKMQYEIADTGIGMSEEEISRLFRPFTQADMSHSRRFGGTGLGLYISQRLAKMLGGQIEIESEPNVGSVVTLTIDSGSLEDVEMETHTPTFAKEEKAAEAGQKQKLWGRILFVEDVTEMRMLVRINLEKLGLEGDLAENGQIALEKASTSKAEGRPYDLILMDIQMPELDGYEATRRLRQNGWKGPIIALTAHAMIGDREKCMKAGCDDYISKPMTNEELFSTIARHLDKAPPGPSAGAAGT